VNAGVGAPGDRRRNRLAKDRRERPLELGLNGALVRLGGPPGEVRPVIGERELRDHYVKCAAATWPRCPLGDELE